MENEGQYDGRVRFVSRGSHHAVFATEAHMLGRRGTVKYEFRVQPGADPSRIRLRYDGAGHLSLGDHGELRIPLGAGQLIDAAPRTVQHIGQESLWAGTTS